MHHSARQSRGYVLVWCAVAMMTLMGVMSLGLDWGLKSLVNSEVQAAADASALAGAQRFSELSPTLDSETRLAEVRAAMIAAGEANATTNGTLYLGSADVEVGRWDTATRSFTLVSIDEANAVRATVERSASRGNGIDTVLARVFGISKLSSRRRSIAMLDLPPSYALIGLDSFTSRGLLTVDGSPWSRQGHIASNGEVKLNVLGLLGVTLVDGHVATRTGVAYPLIGALTVIREGERCPAKPFVLPTVSDELATKSNDNAQLGGLLCNGNLTVVLLGEMPAGTYLVHDLTIAVGALLRVTGPATIYVTGQVNILGSVLLLQGNPADLKIRTIGGGSLTVAANVLLSADIYAPERNILIGVGVVYRGRLIGRSITILGTSLFYLRPDLPPPELGRSRVRIVG